MHLEINLTESDFEVVDKIIADSLFVRNQIIENDQLDSLLDKNGDVKNEYELRQIAYDYIKRYQLVVEPKAITSIVGAIWGIGYSYRHYTHNMETHKPPIVQNNRDETYAIRNLNDDVRFGYSSDGTFSLYTTLFGWRRVITAINDTERQNYINNKVKYVRFSRHYNRRGDNTDITFVDFKPSELNTQTETNEPQKKRLKTFQEIVQEEKEREELERKRKYNLIPDPDLEKQVYVPLPQATEDDPYAFNYIYRLPKADQVKMDDPNIRSVQLHFSSENLYNASDGIDSGLSKFLYEIRLRFAFIEMIKKDPYTPKDFHPYIKLQMHESLLMLRTREYQEKVLWLLDNYDLIYVDDLTIVQAAKCNCEVLAMDIYYTGWNIFTCLLFEEAKRKGKKVFKVKPDECFEGRVKRVII